MQHAAPPDAALRARVRSLAAAEIAPFAAAVDASTDPDVVADRDTLSGFLAPGQEVHSQVFRLTRSR